MRVAFVAPVLVYSRLRVNDGLAVARSCHEAVNVDLERYSELRVGPHSRCRLVLFGAAIRLKPNSRFAFR